MKLMETFSHGSLMISRGQYNPKKFIDGLGVLALHTSVHKISHIFLHLKLV
jgi:hypothetical protein